MGKVVRLGSKKRDKETGFILVVGIFVMLFMLLLIAPFLSKLSSHYRTTEKGFKALSSLNLAEAGVEMAVFELNQMWLYSSWILKEDGTLFFTLDNFSSSDGRIAGDIEIAIFPLVDENRSVESTGKVPFISSLTVNRNVRVVLETEYGSIFKFAVFADEGIYMASNVDIDSYDTSVKLLYDREIHGINAHVGTNSSIPTAQGGGIYFSSQGNIYGNVACGVGTRYQDINKVIDTNAVNTHIEGGKYVLGTLFDMTPDPPVSSFVEDLTYNLANPSLTFNTKGKTAILNETSSGIYDSFTVGVNTKVQVQGDVTLCITGFGDRAGTFLMENNSVLEIAPGGRLTLVLGNTTFLQKSNATVNNLTKTASNLLILGTEEFNGEMHWNSNAALYSAICVPEATVHYDSNHDLYGSLICNYLDFNSNADIHYDEALCKLNWIRGGIPHYVVVSWQDKR